MQSFTRLTLPERSGPSSVFWNDLETPRAFGATRARRFEYSSQGDRVPGRLLLPAQGDGPFPLVLLQHGAGGSKEAPYMDAAARWVNAGAAVASIDFPLHGERRSAKLTDKLLHGLRVELGDPVDDGFDPETLVLVSEFTRQAVADLAQALDVLATVAELDARRVGYASFSLGSLLGAIFCALDPRPRAAALALGGGGFGPPSLDPARYVAGIAPRPLLMINAIDDALIPKQAAEALFDAAGEPKRRQWFETEHHALPGQALKAMWSFLAENLEMGDATGQRGKGA